MRVWFDCSAAAHPVVLRPVIERFRERGDEVLVTARDYGQTVGILELHGIDHLAVGRHGGASRLGKARALAGRSLRLLAPVKRFNPDLAVGHGSVDLAIVSKLLGIPSVQLQDYEFAGLQRQLAFRAARKVLVPESIPVDRMTRVGAGPEKLVRYPGLKEDYYLADFQPDVDLPDRMGIDPSQVLVVLRPPPETSEYHEDNPVHEAVLRLLAKADGVTCVFIPRTGRQAAAARAMGSGNLIVPDRAIDAQSLIAAADLVISAGGTMNREAVALGTPVYSTFAGRVGGVDEALIAEGSLEVLDDPSSVALVKKSPDAGQRTARDPSQLVEGILSALD